MYGEVLSQLGDIDQAIIQYHTAIRLAPTAKLFLRFASALARHNRYDEAIKYLQQAKRIDMQNAAKYEILVAKVHRMKGRDASVNARNRLQAISDSSSTGDDILIFWELASIDAEVQKTASPVPEGATNKKPKSKVLSEVR
jgi:tetratricopeptide (TPR) repeat protein